MLDEYIDLLNFNILNEKRAVINSIEEIQTAMTVVFPGNIITVVTRKLHQSDLNIDMYVAHCSKRHRANNSL